MGRSRGDEWTDGRSPRLRRLPRGGRRPRCRSLPRMRVPVTARLRVLMFVSTQGAQQNMIRQVLTTFVLVLMSVHAAAQTPETTTPIADAVAAIDVEAVSVLPAPRPPAPSVRERV